MPRRLGFRQLHNKGARAKRGCAAALGAGLLYNKAFGSCTPEKADTHHYHSFFIIFSTAHAIIIIMVLLLIIIVSRKASGDKGRCSGRGGSGGSRR